MLHLMCFLSDYFVTMTPSRVDSVESIERNSGALETSSYKKENQSKIMNCTDSVNFTIPSEDSDVADKDRWSNDWDIGLKIAFPIICSVVASISIDFLNTFLKDLNQWIKNILTILSVHIALSSLTSASILFFWNENSFEKCGTLHIISITNGFITLDNLALISFVKCYLARKTAQFEGINVFLVIALAVLIYVG